MPGSIEYDFLAPPRIIFGWGRRREVGPLAAELGRRAFIVCGSRTLAEQGELNRLSELLQGAGVTPLPLTIISHEPLTEDVDRGVADLRQQRAGPGDLILAIGGGSALDLGKAIAALAAQRNAAPVADYLEGVGRGLKIIEPPLPVLAMPTTGGTGSEATKNAVISSRTPAYKKSLRADAMVPRIVLVDPELSVAASPQITAYTGMDAITQLIESYISRRAKPIPRALALHGLRRAVPALAEVVQDGHSQSGREAMSHAALLSGIALANSGLGIAHGVAAALGVICDVPHGLACAVMLPAALRANRHVCEAQYAELAAAVIPERSFASAAQAADALVERIDQLCATIGIPRRLSEIGVRLEQIPQLVAGSHGNSRAGNPRDLSGEELSQILEQLLGAD